METENLDRHPPGKGNTVKTSSASRLNGLRHGIYARVPLGDLPRPFKHVRRLAGEFRRGVEGQLVEKFGNITPFMAKRLHTACVALRQMFCCERILKRCGPPGQDLTHEQWLAYSDRLVKFSEVADKALKDLGLDSARQSDIWDDLYAANRPSLLASQAHETPEEAQSAKEGNGTDCKSNGELQTIIEGTPHA